ncbi:PepSY domain-containing protein [Salinisphaera aquimarina]|uniref:PepSY domain-containing protein n=1 Tax=Salinisphaera aquimarina TaxID=2094031 RepID=A0ABV7EN87_9GAMM
MEAAHNVHQGDFVKVEYLSVSPKGVPTYEIELRDEAGTEWELMCNARTGDIYELETEVDSPQDPTFASTAKISEDEARKTATDRFGGEIVEIEYEIEADGSPTYEIDLAQPGQNNEFKVEVDAVTGDIIEMSVEEWQIGEEPSEEVAASGDEAQT